MTLAVEVRRASPAYEEIVDRWVADGLVERLWAKDPTLWSDPPRDEVANRLGWLDLPRESRSLLPEIHELSDQAASEGITDLVLCGMGGSSLAPEVFAASLPSPSGRPALTVADTTHPDYIVELRARLDPATTWWLISSKSGGTLETLSLFRYFWEMASTAVREPGQHFLAVTDPGSTLADLGSDRGFRSVMFANPEVGGRYSALSAFGLLPAGIVGADLDTLLDEAAIAVEDCRALGAENPALMLGAALGAIPTDGLSGAYFSGESFAASLPVWIEQLIAESTGKEGVGILPIAEGSMGPASDVLKVGLGPTIAPEADIAVEYTDPSTIGAAMFTLEMATAIAGEALGINPFDQPDVQLAKTLADEAMRGGDVEPVAYLTDPGEAARELHRHGADAEYVAIQAFLAPSRESQIAVDRLATDVSSSLGLPTTVGFGPRFLHSTGQLHKGGQPGGLFIQLVDAPGAIVNVPETDYSFNRLIRAQAAGDAAALRERGRALIPLDVSSDALAGIKALSDALA